ncbi:MAG: hypothetical protein LBL13_05875 [Bacteroidales bacterium]|jgi:hypothetical protein|nr:hypothetical protein [Bacteroidales bacterium]
MKNIEERLEQYVASAGAIIDLMSLSKKEIKILVTEAYREGAKSSYEWIDVDVELPNPRVPVLIKTDENKTDGLQVAELIREGGASSHFAFRNTITMNIIDDVKFWRYVENE